jgi:hypothetical protein
VTSLLDNQIKNPTIKLFRFIGYGFLLLSLLDIFGIFFPLRFMNPEWEVQTITSLVERVAAPLIGTALVFYQDLQLRSKWEFLVLKCISWAALGVGILYFLLLPLLVMDNIRLDATISSLLNNRINQQTAQADQLIQRLKKASSKTDINVLLGGQGLPPDLKGKDIPQIKQNLLAKVAQEKPNIRKQTEVAFADRRFNQLKITVKIFLGAVVSGFSFIYIWALTDWARLPHPSSQSKKSTIEDTWEP